MVFSDFSRVGWPVALGLGNTSWQEHVAEHASFLGAKEIEEEEEARSCYALESYVPNDP